MHTTKPDHAWPAPVARFSGVQYTTQGVAGSTAQGEKRKRKKIDGVDISPKQMRKKKEERMQTPAVWRHRLALYLKRRGGPQKEKEWSKKSS